MPTTLPEAPAELDFPLRAHDVRRKRPPALSFLLRLDTLRRTARVTSLLALDFVGIFAAILALQVFVILVLNHPFSGDVRVSPEPFEHVVRDFGG